MAYFGAPLADPDHAAHAIDSRWPLLVELEELNAARSARGALPRASASASTRASRSVGDIGSPAHRLEYTGIGDTVNVAFRIEASQDRRRAQSWSRAPRAPAVGDATPSARWNRCQSEAERAPPRLRAAARTGG